MAVNVILAWRLQQLEFAFARAHHDMRNAFASTSLEALARAASEVARPDDVDLLCCVFLDASLVMPCADG
eukprot:14853387-Alexandrium_andersonii.AAC.1